MAKIKVTTLSQIGIPPKYFFKDPKAKEPEKEHEYVPKGAIVEVDEEEVAKHPKLYAPLTTKKEDKPSDAAEIKTTEPPAEEDEEKKKAKKGAR
jgi:hypothetical protein